MTADEVKAMLCVYDSRSPYYLEGYTKSPGCACDYCFSGASELAEFTLTLMEGQ